MLMLAAERVSKQYDERKLLDEVTLYIEERDKLGIIGPNGAGKSTLLKLLAGKETPDAGIVTTRTGVCRGYLSQTPDFLPERSALDTALAGLPESMRASHVVEVRAMLTRLGVTDVQAMIGTLSGGQRKRVALAAALTTPCEVLLLDEPTNHLDSETIEWLEKWLRRYTGALVMVTHDRYFLDRVVGKIVEVDRGSLSFYETNYRGYVEQKAERMQVEAGMRRKLSSLLRKEMDWMHQGAKARGTKSRYRIERVATMEENLESGTTQGKLTMDAASSRLGRKTLAMRTVSKAYGEQTVIHSFSMQLLRDDRIGIVGANGCGKTTLLRLIEGTLAPDTGEVERGETVRMGVFRQEADELDPALRVIDAVQEIAPHVQTKEGVLTASQMLENFLFPGTMQYAKVGKLSGGEKRRLMLLRVLMSAPNVLLLDEPTNDLDIDTLTVLEDYLASFPGAVVAVSHDRYFLDKVAERVFAFSGHGEIREYVGGYRDWREAVETAPPCEETRRVEPTVRRTLPRKLKFTYQEEREFAQIEQLIADAEAQLEALDVQAQAAASDYLQLQALDAQKAAKEAELEEKMARWVYLTEKQEAIARQE